MHQSRALTMAVRCLLAAGMTAALAGCGEPGLPTAPVHGMVTYDGKPLPTGTVTFIPDTPGHPPAYGEINESGVYSMTTYKPGDGAVLGSHRIMIAAFKVDPNRPEAMALLPSKYGSEQVSGLTAEVKEGDNVVDFPLLPEKRRGAK